jgi:hypothetical protein
MPDTSDTPDRERPDREEPAMAHRLEAAEGSGGSAGSDVRIALSIREAAVRTGRSEAAIYHLIAIGQLVAQPTPSRGLSIQLTDLEQVERRRRASRRSGWPMHSMWEGIWQRGRATMGRLRMGMRSLFATMPRDFPGPPLCWIMPCCAVLIPRW